MRLLDDGSNRKLDRVTLYLSRSEADELKSSLEEILERPEGNHAHISSEDFEKEITICIYDENLLDGFSERSKKLIQEDI